MDVDVVCIAHWLGGFWLWSLWVGGERKGPMGEWGVI